MRGLIVPLRYDFDDWTLAASEQVMVTGSEIDSRELVPFRPSEGLDPDLLRIWTLFWDDIRYPTWDDERVVIPEDQLLLFHEGILQTIKLGETEISRDPDFESLRVEEGEQIDYERVLSWMQLAAFQSLNQAEPGCWSVLSDASSHFPKSLQIMGRAWLVSLYDTVPVPAGDVALEDVLAFKDKRRPELLSLRHHLETIYQRVLSAGDGELALATEKGLLERAIQDYVRVTKERRFKINWANIEAKLDWEFNPSLATIAAITGYLAGGPVSATVAGVTASFLPKVNLSNTTKIEGVSKRMTPFEYITSIQEKLR